MMLGRLRNLLARQTPPAASARPRLTATGLPTAIYAIGDVHGCLAELLQLEARIAEDAAGFSGEKWLVMLGDYIDRGPASYGVIAHLLAPAPGDFRRICLAGNHEQMLLDGLHEPGRLSDWLAFGGTETATSYGLSPSALAPGRIKRLGEALRSAIPQAHLDWLEALPVCLCAPGLIFVHAGVESGRPLEEQSDEDLMWMRSPFIDQDGRPDLLVVHGHTPAAVPRIAPGRIGVDTAAFATGTLTAVRLRQNEPPMFLASNG